MKRYIFVILNPTRQKENVQILKSVYSVKYKDIKTNSLFGAVNWGLNEIIQMDLQIFLQCSFKEIFNIWLAGENGMRKSKNETRIRNNIIIVHLGYLQEKL